MFNIRSVLRIAQPRLSQSLPKASYHWRIDDFALALLTPEFTIDVQKKIRGCRGNPLRLPPTKHYLNVYIYLYTTSHGVQLKKTASRVLLPCASAAVLRLIPPRLTR